MRTRRIVGWALVAVLAVFVGFNLDPAQIWFFGVSIEMPVALVVLFSAALGASAMYMFSYIKARPKAKQQPASQE